ncbi:Sec-independent protein translocase subunit TatA/TatB [Rubinisphaera italica]|uniref:Sec-independent protein translocase protein TatA n=1 Tax=Rubinisphaera italica TaxID=2527969 RepID=A0A5C5X990_9PLAN|nr:twin-arginine translocase TatA/TatE family subunit [Rubinisphaera italica]TWT59414.1 twin arginine translocase protein A [Rubinisphaera italica]
MFSPGWTEMIIIGFIALLLFGKRLPEVARSLGQGFVEFKRGMTSIETDMRKAAYSEPAPAKPVETKRVEEDLRPTADKFEAPEPPRQDD